MDPEKIPSSGQVPRDISQLAHVSYSIPRQDTFLRGTSIRYSTKHRLYIPFPDNTRGFLYYKSPKQGYPDIAGSLRFRVVSGPHSSFANGVDLKLPTGGVWQIHIYTVVRAERHAGLLIKLLEEGLVSPSVVEKIRSLPPALLQSQGQILYKLEDPFVARLHCVESLVCMTQESVKTGPIMPIFIDARQHIKMHPYEGMLFISPIRMFSQDNYNPIGYVLVRFERSTLAEHANTRTILLRILKELSPIECVFDDYDSYIARPTSGRLVSGIFHKGGRKYRPWSANLDKGKGKASELISLLWPRHPDGTDTT